MIMSSPVWRECELRLARASRPEFAMTVLLTLVTTVASSLGDNVDATSTTTLLLPTSTSTTTTTTTFGDSDVCGGVTRCLNHTQCAQCLSAINASRGFVHSQAEFYSMSLASERQYQVGFFETLLSTASCSTNATPSGILYPVLQELGASSCMDAYRMAVGECSHAEYTCFVTPDCRRYLAALYSSKGNGEKAEAISFLASHAATIGSALLSDLKTICANTFPACTFFKQQCGNSSECGQCMATFDSGDGAGAARQCRGTTTSAAHLNNVVKDCISNAVSCSFWSQRCADDVNCSACLAVLNNEQSAVAAAAADWSTLACQRATQDSFASRYIDNIIFGCPAISLCQQAVASCVINYGPTCIACLNGSTQSSDCSRLQLQFSFDTACQPCPDAVHTIIIIVLITTVVGGASAVVCLAIAATIVAHGHSRVSMRYRIVVGLMLANAQYSTANTIPLNALHTGVIDCGRLVMSFGAIRVGRAWWFCGKYGLVSFELFILGASIRALLVGSSAVPAWAEAMMHAACWTCAFAAFGVFYSLCSGINTAGYNDGTENVAYTDTFNHMHLNDDLDDDTPSIAASVEFERGRAKYDNLVRNMLVAWDALVGMAVVLWVVLRLMYRHALRMLDTKFIAAAQAEAADVWADTRRSRWLARHRLLEARKQAFDEVAKPLEPYIAVFVVFAAPAILMSTSFCQAHSGASFANGASSDTGFINSNFSYGTCDVWCEFVLAFRSLATVAVYLLPRERRVELVAVRTTWRKLVSRAVGCVCCRPARSPYVQLHHIDRAGAYEMLELALEPPADRDNHGDNVEGANLSTWHLNEHDVVKVRCLGRGTFGEVWEGMVRADDRRVAIKTLFAGAVDSDGDLVDSAADEDFRKECIALQRIDSPHLIKFYGFGTTKSGSGFIVTELMGGGSLEGVLHNHKCDVSWRTRVSFGLQIALGMDHLHQRHIVHRDLKSANVLVNEQHTIAKVCDFGLSRIVKPTQRYVVSYSPFTGVTRLLPRVAGVEESSEHDVLSLSDIAVSIEDARGNMTKAAGTMLWMAPEMFRGDRNYDFAVDVYSFGIVLWELATRKVPWGEIECGGSRTVLFEALNRALQTGRRPTIPAAVLAEHGAFVAVMSRCWAGDPADRLTFSEAARDLAALLSSETLE